MNLVQRLRIKEQLHNLPWRRVVAGAFTVLVFGYFFVTLASNWQSLLEYEWRIAPSYLLASLTAYVLSLLLGASVWHWIVWSMDQSVPYRKGVKYFLQSQLAKRIPGLVWYALGRLYLYDREGVKKSVVSVALALEIATVAVGGVLAYLITIWGDGRAIEATHQVWLILPLAGLVAVMLWPKSLYTLVNWVLARRGHPVIDRQASRGDLLRWSLVQAAAWLCGGVFIFFLAAGVYPGLDWSDMIVVNNSWAGSGLLALAAQVVPLGLGIKDVTLAYLLSSLVPWPVAVLISLLGRICSIIGDCIGLLVASRL